MQLSIKINNNTFRIDLSKPLDLSIGLQGNDQDPTAWYLEAPQIVPVRAGSFVGKVSQGGSTNFNNIRFNPHAHGTHTECVGHISAEFHSVNQSLKEYFFWTRLLTVSPEPTGSDQVISKAQLDKHVKPGQTKALVLRTLPNDTEKLHRKYSHTNWPYLQEEAAIYIRECGIKHLLIDLPSVDKEKDGGELLAHKAFWSFPNNSRYDATITEMIYVPNSIPDGEYLMNLQVAPFENDASPSRPVLYEIEHES